MSKVETIIGIVVWALCMARMVELICINLGEILRKKKRDNE